MNHDYASCGISYYLAGTDKTYNPTWFDQAGPSK